MARFCAECGTALEEGHLFCTSCGARVAAGAPPVAAAELRTAHDPPAEPTRPVAAPPAAERGGGIPLPLILGALAGAAVLLAGLPVAGAIAAFVVVGVVVSLVRGILGLLFGRGLAVALATLLVMGSCSYAAAAYAQGPDFRGIPLPTQRDLAKALPFLRQRAPLAPRDAELERLRSGAKAATAAASAQLVATKQKLIAAGLPVVAVRRTATEGGEAVLSVGLDFERLAGPLSSSGGVLETFGSLVRIAQIKDLDLKGLQHVSVGVLDGAGRLIFSAAAPVAALEGFRAGTLKQSDLASKLAFKGENRIAILDAIRRIATK